MRQKTGTQKAPAEKTIRNIRRATRKKYSTDEKIRIVLEGQSGEKAIAALCRAKGSRRALFGRRALMRPMRQAGWAIACNLRGGNSG